MRFIAITILCAVIGILIGSCVGVGEKMLNDAGVFAYNNMLNPNFWR